MVYIGQTACGMLKRKQGHIARSRSGDRGHRLYLDMRKYGPDAFRFDELCCCLRSESLSTMEKHFIKEYDSFERGYNMTRGDGHVSDEAREKISLALRGREVTWSNKAWETRRKRPGKRPSDYVAKGASNTKSKSYIARDPAGTEILFSGLNQFCKQRGLTKKCLLDTLVGKQRHHKGYSLLCKVQRSSPMGE